MIRRYFDAIAILIDDLSLITLRLLPSRCFFCRYAFAFLSPLMFAVSRCFDHARIYAILQITLYAIFSPRYALLMLRHFSLACHGAPAAMITLHFATPIADDAADAFMLYYADTIDSPPASDYQTEDVRLRRLHRDTISLRYAEIRHC